MVFGKSCIFLIGSFVLHLQTIDARNTDPSFSTTARISPTSLIPSGQAGVALKSKMVDFAIHVEPSDRFRMAVRERAQLSTASMSVNNTLHEPLRCCPIGVSIETKLTGENWDEAMAQVGIWTAAQFNKLEELIAEADKISDQQGFSRDKSEPSLPFLPIIIVQGHDWHFLVAVRNPGQQTVSVQIQSFFYIRSIVDAIQRLYHKITFGSTASPLGVYQVIVTIQLLACWVRDHFTEWFERSCLNLPKEAVSDVT